VNGEECSLIEISRKGNLFMRTSWAYAGGSCPAGGRSIWIDLTLENDCPKKLEDYGLYCDRIEFKDVMLSADGMFAEPTRKNPEVKSKVDLTMSVEPVGDTWYELEFFNELPVTDADGGKKITASGTEAQANLYALIDLRPGKKRTKVLLGTFDMPFALTVCPEGCPPQ
jgi:hypothetical protein